MLESVSAQETAGQRADRPQDTHYYTCSLFVARLPACVYVRLFCFFCAYMLAFQRERWPPDSTFAVLDRSQWEEGEKGTGTPPPLPENPCHGWPVG